MVTSSQRVAVTREASVGNVGELRHAVVSFATANGAGTRELEDVALAVSEALSNAVLHAYPHGSEPGPVSVEAWMHGEALVVQVSDEGVGMTAVSARSGLGLGLPLMAGIARSFAVGERDTGAGVCIRLELALS